MKKLEELEELDVGMERWLDRLMTILCDSFQKGVLGK